MALAAACVATVLIVQGVSAKKVPNPVWHGRHLSEWIRADNKETGQAVIALGSNAVPMLLVELQAENYDWAKLASKVLDIVDFGSQRRYRAAIYLQYLDTNAVPAVMDAALASPFQVLDAYHGNLSCQAAHVLQRLDSPAADQIRSARLDEAMASPLPLSRCNACLVFYLGTKPTAKQIVRIAELSRDPDATVRAAALRALHMWHHNEAAAVPALLAGLQDKHPCVRRLAIEAIQSRGSNAVNLLPALRDAYRLEPTQPRASNSVDFVFTRVISDQDIRSAILSAFKQIDPKATPP